MTRHSEQGDSSTPRPWFWEWDEGGFSIEVYSAPDGPRLNPLVVLTIQNGDGTYSGHVQAEHDAELVCRLANNPMADATRFNPHGYPVGTPFHQKPLWKHHYRTGKRRAQEPKPDTDEGSEPEATVD